MALSDSLGGKVGKKTKKGTLITEDLVNAVAGDEAAILVIQEDNTKIVQEAIDRALMTALEEVGLVAEGKAKKLCPVDTGRLRNSITHALDNVTHVVMIGTNVEYAPEVHQGTSKRKPQPFLTDAAQHNESLFRQIFEKHLRGT